MIMSIEKSTHLNWNERINETENNIFLYSILSQIKSTGQYVS